MNLLHPLALAWLGLAIPIVIFYILKIRHEARPGLDDLVLAADLRGEAAAVDLAAAPAPALAAGPARVPAAWSSSPWPSRSSSGRSCEARRLVLVVDNSASMNADRRGARSPAGEGQGGGPGRDRRPPVPRRDGDHRRGDRSRRSVCGLTGHQRTLRAALDGDRPDRRADAGQGGRRAGPPAPGRPGREPARVDRDRLTDGGFEDAAKLGRRPTTSRSSSVGQAGRQRRDHPVPGPPQPARPDRLPDPRRGRQRLRRRPVETAGSRSTSTTNVGRRRAAQARARRARGRKVIEKTSADGGRLVARLDRADALPADNQAWAILPRRDIQPVTLVTDGNLFLEKVLRGQPAGQAEPSPRNAAGRDPPRASRSSITKVPDQLPPGPVLVIEPTTSDRPLDIGESLQNPIVTKQDKDSPLMAHVRLDNVLMPEARQLKLNGAKVQVLADVADRRPALLRDRPARGEGAGPDGRTSKRATCRSRPRSRSWWPTPWAGSPGPRASFASRSSTGRGRPRSSCPAPAEARAAWLLRSPDGRTTPLADRGNKVTVGPLDQCGVWSIVRPPGEAEAQGRAPSCSRWPATWRAARRATSGPPPGLDSPRRRWSGWVRRLADLGRT